MRIMIVDDSKIARTVLKKVLRDIGHTEFVDATNGLEAIDLLKRRTVDLVITDWHMPTLDGLGLVREMRKSGQPDVPILMVSTESSPDRIVEIMQAGVQGYIQKPFSAKSLSAKIAVIEKKRQFSEGYRRSESSLSGSLQEIGFPELIQLVCSSGMSGLLEIEAGSDGGRLHFENGEVYSSSAGPRRRHDAFFALAELTSGRFLFIRNGEVGPKNMTVRTLPLLMEVLRLRDERAAQSV